MGDEKVSFNSPGQMRRISNDERGVAKIYWVTAQHRRTNDCRIGVDQIRREGETSDLGADGMHLTDPIRKRRGRRARSAAVLLCCNSRGAMIDMEKMQQFSTGASFAE